MKLTSTVTLIALTVLAAASPIAKADPAADPEPWCRHPGQPCWKVKRAAEAFTDSIKGSSALAAREADPDPWCRHPGQPCWKGKRDAAPEPAPWCRHPGQPCWKAKRSIEELGNIIAVVTDDPEGFYNALGLEESLDDDNSTDASEIKKREADPWCRHPGQPCWKEKRDVEAQDDELAKRWCRHPGQPCWKAKRAAEAVVSAIDSESATVKREADPWCRHPGQPCWKAKRDLHAIQNVARSLIESLE
jgi:hypothetical protein